MSQKYTPGVMEAATIVMLLEETEFPDEWIEQAAAIIDREAVQPAVKGLLEKFKKIRSESTADCELVDSKSTARYYRNQLSRIHTIAYKIMANQELRDAALAKLDPPKKD